MSGYGAKPIQLLEIFDKGCGAYSTVSDIPYYTIIIHGLIQHRTINTVIIN